jgi:hypothetical protein
MERTRVIRARPVVAVVTVATAVRAAAVVWAAKPPMVLRELTVAAAMAVPVATRARRVTAERVRLAMP